MLNKSRKNFFLILILSILLHLLLVFTVLIMQFDNFVPPASSNHMPAQKTAPVVFQDLPQHLAAGPQQAPKTQQPQQKILPAPFIPLVEQEEKQLKQEQKIPTLLTSGAAAGAAASVSSQEVIKERDKASSIPVKDTSMDKAQGKIEQTGPEEKKTSQPLLQEQEQPTPQIENLPHEKPVEQKVKEKHEELPGSSTYKPEHTPKPQKTSLTPHVELPHANKLFEPSAFHSRTQRRTTEQVNKKITLAQIAQDFLQQKSSEHVGTGIDSHSNHVATVIGGPAGAATEEQLRYERYAVKLMACINNSFAILFPHFRFVHKPSTRELTFTFVMDVNTKGDIVALTVRQATGNSQFDDFMVKLLYHASKSFPPLPSYFKARSCSFPIQCIMPTEMA